MTSTQAGSSLQLAPLRSVNDFLLESARFQLPNFQDFEKWGNRVVKNLLYYQTNYMLMSGAVFLLIGLIHPYKVILGMMVIMALLYVFVKFFAAEARRTMGAASSQQQPNKWAVLGGVLGCCYLLLFMFDAVLIVMLAVLLPFSRKSNPSPQCFVLSISSDFLMAHQPLILAITVSCYFKANLLLQ